MPTHTPRSHEDPLSDPGALPSSDPSTDAPDTPDTVLGPGSGTGRTTSLPIPDSHAYLARLLLKSMAKEWPSEDLDQEFKDARKTLEDMTTEWRADKTARQSASEPSHSIDVLRKWHPERSSLTAAALQRRLESKSEYLNAVWHCLTGDPSHLTDRGIRYLRSAERTYNAEVALLPVPLGTGAVVASLQYAAAATGHPIAPLHQAGQWALVLAPEAVHRLFGSPGTLEHGLRHLADYVLEASERSGPQSERTEIDDQHPLGDE